MKVKAGVIACGLAVCLFTQTAVAKYCKTYQLTGSNNRVALAATIFTITNEGPAAVAIETGVDDTIQVFPPTKSKEIIAFAGDVSDTYFLKLYPENDIAKVTICNGMGELEDATAANNRHQ